MDKKLSDNEIVKALEEMASDCPANFSASVLDFIHRLQSENAEQKAEIERLTEREKFLENAWHTSIEHTKTVERGLKASEARSTEFQKQAEKLKEENEYLDMVAKQALADCEKLQKQVDELKRENAKVISFNDALYREKEQAVKDTAKEILDELDLFFKGTTFRKGYEFKKIDEKLKEIAKRKGVEVE